MNPLTAAVIWDEDVDGDLSNEQATPTVLTITEGGTRDQIIGKVGGSNPGEFFDVFSFELPQGYCLESIVLERYNASSGNQGSGFNLHSGPASVGANFLVGNSAGENQVGDDVLGGEGPFPSGVYTMDIRESTSRQRYELALVYCSEGIWNEVFEGDLSDVVTSPTSLDVPLTNNGISGSIGGQGGAGIDAFSMTVPVGYEADIYLRSYTSTTSNATTGFNLYSGLNGSAGSLLKSALLGERDIDDAINTVPLSAGEYSVIILERVAGQKYGLDFEFIAVSETP